MALYFVRWHPILSHSRGLCFMLLYIHKTLGDGQAVSKWNQVPIWKCDYVDPLTRAACDEQCEACLMILFLLKIIHSGIWGRLRFVPRISVTGPHMIDRSPCHNSWSTAPTKRMSSIRCNFRAIPIDLDSKKPKRCIPMSGFYFIYCGPTSHTIHPVASQS